MKHVSKWLRTHGLRVKGTAAKKVIQLTAHDSAGAVVAVGQGAGMAQAFFDLMTKYNERRRACAKES